MVSLGERERIVHEALGDPSLANVYRLIFDQPIETPIEGDKLGRMVSAISNSRKREFERLWDDFTSRVVTPETDWIHNDCLMFLLVLGSKIFNLSSGSIDAVLIARESNTNPAARKSNHVFRSLARQEYSLEGEYAFVKAVYLDLTGQLSLNRASSMALFDALTDPNLLSELPPFLRLLAIRAFDLLVNANAPTRENTYAEIVESIRRLSPQWTLKETLNLVRVLPLKLSITLLLVFVTALSSAAGVGYWFKGQFVEPNSNTKIQQKVPSKLDSSSE